MIHKKKSSKSEELKGPTVESVESLHIKPNKIQTAEGWKRSMDKKRKESKA